MSAHVYQSALGEEKVKAWIYSVGNPVWESSLAVGFKLPM